MHNQDSTGLFGKYSKRFQEQVLKGLLTDEAWAGQMYEVMRPDYFDVRYLEYLADRVFAYYAKYKCFPSLSLIVTIVRDDLVEGNDVILRDQIVEFLHRLKAEGAASNDLQYIKDKALDFCKRQAFRQALEQAVTLIDDDKFEGVVEIMKNAVMVGMPHTIGHDFFEDLEARFHATTRVATPTGIPQLDEKSVFDGGLAKGELGVVVAPTGVGKSHWLVAMGAAAMRRGKNVLHYTFELSEKAVGLRYDANLCDIPVSELTEQKERVLDTYKSSDYGRLIIKEFPTGSASVMTLRGHIEKLGFKGFVPHVVLIDYADIMRSSRSFDALRLELKLIYEELRGMATDLRIPIWTASQANRDAANSDIVGLENMSEAYGKAQVADVVVSISRKSTEKSTGAGRLFVAKNRAGRDGILYPLSIDTTRSKFTVLDDRSLTLNEAIEDDDRSRKDLLRKKWQEVQRTDWMTNKE